MVIPDEKERGCLCGPGVKREGWSHNWPWVKDEAFETLGELACFSGALFVGGERQRKPQGGSADPEEVNYSFGFAVHGGVVWLSSI